MSVEIAAHVRTVTGLLVLPALGCFVSCAEDQFVQVLTQPRRCTFFRPGNERARMHVLHGIAGLTSLCYPLFAFLVGG